MQEYLQHPGESCPAVNCNATKVTDNASAISEITAVTMEFNEPWASDRVPGT
jgi:hypothetical protein